MKRFAWAIAATFLTAPLYAGQTLVLQPESTLSLSGDSTLHPYISTATLLDLTAEWEEVDKDLGKALLEKNALKRFSLTVPVKGLKSKESGLDKNMYKALKADEYPNITFDISRYETQKSTRSVSGYQVKAEGVLKIAGQERPVVLELEAVTEGVVLHVNGTYHLLMTDYGIKPPSLMLGAIKVRNPIKIEFNLRLSNTP